MQPHKKNRFPCSRTLLLALPLALGLGLGLGTGAQAQLLSENPDWKESEAPPPPTFEPSRTLAIEMPVYMNLRFAVDPQTITITPDGVVRYVVVASSRTGAVNAFYEGVRCATEEMKTYARHDGQAWQRADASDWRSWRTMNSRYVSELANQALCQGHAPRQSVREMVRYLKQPFQQP